MGETACKWQVLIGWFLRSGGGVLWLLCLARRYCSFFEVYRRPCHDDVWMDQDLSPERTWELRKEVSHIVRGGFEAEIVQTGQNTKHCSLSMPVQICTYCFCFWFWLAPTRVLKLWMTSDKNANNYIYTWEYQQAKVGRKSPGPFCLRSINTNLYCNECSFTFHIPSGVIKCGLSQYWCPFL